MNFNRFISKYIETLDTNMFGPNIVVNEGNKKLGQTKPLQMIFSKRKEYLIIWKFTSEILKTVLMMIPSVSIAVSDFLVLYVYCHKTFAVPL